MSAHLRDEYGNPVQLTDEHGNPVVLTDEHGELVTITGLATKQPLTVAYATQSKVSETGTETTGDVPKTEAGTESGKGGEAGELKKEEQHESSGEIQRSTSSSSSSSEDDGQGGRRKKKKGLTQKLKEKLSLSGKHKEEQGQHASEPGTTTTTAGEAPSPGGEQHHEHKSVLEKIKEKLPGHHSH